MWYMYMPQYWNESQRDDADLTELLSLFNVIGKFRS